MSLTNSDKKSLRQIAHHLDPIVMIGDGGLTDGVSQETDRALDDHELIKVRVNVADRAARQSVAAELAAACRAQVIQQIGKVCVLYRANPKANAKLSNLARHGVKVAR